MKLNFYKDEWEEFLEQCGFTDEECAIIGLLRRGWATVDIAEEIGVSLSTAKRRRARIGEKIRRYLLKKAK